MYPLSRSEGTLEEMFLIARFSAERRKLHEHVRAVGEQPHALATFVHRATIADIQPIVSDTVTLFSAPNATSGAPISRSKRSGPIMRPWPTISARRSRICRLASNDKSCLRLRLGSTGWSVRGKLDRLKLCPQRLDALPAGKNTRAFLLQTYRRDMGNGNSC